MEGDDICLARRDYELSTNVGIQQSLIYGQVGKLICYLPEIDDLVWALTSSFHISLTTII